MSFCDKSFEYKIKNFWQVLTHGFNKAKILLSIWVLITHCMQMAAKTFGFHLLESFSVSNCGEKRRMRKKTWGGRGWEGKTRHLPPPHFALLQFYLIRKKKERRQRRLNFTQCSILNLHSLTLGISSFNFIYLWLDNSNLTTRGNNTRHNIRVNRNWVGHMTWTDQWGLNYSETHWRACHRRLGQC